jgi:hypothetical protein
MFNSCEYQSAGGFRPGDSSAVDVIFNSWLIGIVLRLGLLLPIGGRDEDWFGISQC